MTSLATPAIRRAFPGFTFTPIAHDPVFGAYRYLRADRPGAAALATIDAAKVVGYKITRYPDGRVLVTR